MAERNSPVQTTGLKEFYEVIIKILRYYRELLKGVSSANS